MMEIWTSFAKNGIPSIDNDEWLVFKSNYRKYVLLDEKIEVMQGLKAQKVTLISEAYDTVRNKF